MVDGAAAAQGHPDLLGGIDPSVAPTVTEFGRILKRALRESNGQRVTTGALARHAGISPSSMYAYLAGSTLPAADVLDDILASVPISADRRGELATLRDRVDDGRRTTRPEAPAPRAGLPDQLPADPGRLFGRDAVFAHLDEALTAAAQRLSVAALTGPAGVGKTAAAVHWGHRHRADFPDGVLHVDLAGYSPGSPRDAGDVLVQLLRSLGVSDTAIPEQIADRSGRFRSLLATRRLLLVLDNAQDVDQLRPLLPGAAGPLVVITSRDSLVGLTIELGAQPYHVAPLDHAASAAVLANSAPMLADDASGLALLGRRCGGLPLALRLLGAQVSQRGTETSAELIDDLSTGLDAFDVESGMASIREVLSWSERRLPAATARALQLLGSAPMSRFCADDAAAVLGRDTAGARAEIRRLMRYHLIEATADRHYRMHDLVREYAIERAAAELDGTAVMDADQRLVDWVVSEGARATTALFHDGADTASKDKPLAATEVRKAQAWFDQHAGLMQELVAHTAAAGRPRHTVQVVQVVQRLVVEGMFRHGDGLDILQTGLAAARTLDDLGSAASMLRHLGWVHKMLGDADRSAACLEEALTLSRAVGDDVGEVNTLRVQAAMHSMAGRLTEATELYHRILVLGNGSPTATAVIHNNLAVCARRAGDLDTALTHVRQALELHLSSDSGHAVARTRSQYGEICIDLGNLPTAERELLAGLGWARNVGSQAVEVELLNVIGMLRRAQDDPQQATRCFTEALAGAERLEDHYEQARAHEGAALVAHDAGDVDEAIDRWQQAIRHFDSIGFADADRVRELLERATIVRDAAVPCPPDRNPGSP